MRDEPSRTLSFLRESDIQSLGYDWHALLDVIEETTSCLANGDFVQPIKPYLRYGDLKNRMIAMPAYVGGTIRRAWLKWIAGFPGNIERGLSRAHSVTIINESETGAPLAIMESSMLSAVRTAAVSAFFLKQFATLLGESFRVGIIGFGPVGRTHLLMMDQLYGDRVTEYLLYDIRGVRGESSVSTTRECTDWREVYDQADVVITCTVSKERYIHYPPPASGKILLHVSLRDYEPHVLDHIPLIVVDHWEEVCREQTDIECWHKHGGGLQERVLELPEILRSEYVRQLVNERPTVMFSPMGMAVYDIAVADYFLRLADVR